MNLASTSLPSMVIVALPLAAVVGSLVRSPSRVLTGRFLIWPVTDSARCALLRSAVVAAESLTRVVASGSGPPAPLLEQPANSVAAAVAVARAIRSLRMGDIVSRAPGGAGSACA